MSGRILMIALIVSALTIGGGIWYSATIGSYDEVRNVEQVRVGETSWAVTNYRGIDGDSSPLKLRGCFDFELPYAASTVHAEEATPLVTPGWFECFDAVQIEADIQSGAATVLISQENEPFGFTTYIAHYPDGRGYIWRQINACGSAQFAGEALPVGCPGAATPEDQIRAMSLAGPFENLSLVENTVRGSRDYACFQTELTLALITETFVIVDTDQYGIVDPPACFPPELPDDIDLGQAVLLAGEDANQLIAIYADGRGYAWVVET
ncbi:MAG: DUF6446 family protein [Pseudomonadota bacterium]